MNTFRKLDGDIPRPRTPASELDKWYDSVRDVTLDSLSANDLARACRQQLFLESVVPIAIEKIGSDQFVCDDHADELVIGLVEIPDEFWEKCETLAAKLKYAVTAVQEILDEEDQLRVRKRMSSFPIRGQSKTLESSPHLGAPPDN